MMWVPAQKLSVYRGAETTLVCVVEAHPEALVFWEFNGQMVQEINGVVMKQIRGPPKYKVFDMYILYLHISRVFDLPSVNGKFRRFAIGKWMANGKRFPI